MPAKYIQDEQGQWWYLWGSAFQYKQRAYSYTCQECGETFARRKPYEPGKGLFCGRVCAGRRLAEQNKGICAAMDKSPNWKGGRIIKRGYMYVYAPDHPHAVSKYIRENRLIMEQHLGRYLLPGEHVHHIDGNRLNNDISNLRLMGESQHHKLHSHTISRDETGRYVKTGSTCH